jgi:hypothetical protein
MDLLKKNIVTIVCGVIVLLAIVAIFYPISGYYEELRQKAEARRGVYQALKGLTEKQRSLPIIELGTTSQAAPLTMFPTPAVAEKGQRVVELVKSEAANMFDVAVKMNQRPPLVPGALPDGPPIASINFRNKYLQRFDAITPEHRSQSLVAHMNAGSPPSDTSIAEKRVVRETEIKSKIVLNQQGQAINATQVQQELDSVLPTLARNMQLEAAKKCTVYIDPPQQGTAIAPALDPHPMLLQHGGGGGGMGAPEPTIIFNAQVGLWIQEDVVLAIAAANKGAANVMESAVKRLVKIDLPDEMFRPLQASPDGMMPTANADPTQAMQPNYLLSPTGRVSNGVYDVVPFTLKMDVDAERLPMVLQELSRNRFITVLSVNIATAPVDKALLEAAGYLYGDKPAIQVELTCEALLLRKWTEPLMPKIVKQMLGITPPPQPTQ